MDIDFSNSEYYFNRELSWLEFNHRVMMQALAEDNPVFERMKFLSIVTSNLDEFFMIRVASIRDQLRAKYQKRDAAGYTPKRQLSAISKRAHTLSDTQYAIYRESILPELADNSIRILRAGNLNEEQMRFCTNYFKDSVYPVITPMSVDKSHPFPLILNKSLNLGVLLKAKSGKHSKNGNEIFATVQVPSILPRLVRIPSEIPGEIVFVPLEEIIRMNIATVFSGFKILCCSPYRITRNGDLPYDEEDAVDLLAAIKKSLKQRKRGSVIRLEIEKGVNDTLLSMLMNWLEVDKKEVYLINGPINLNFLMKELYGLDGFDKLKYPKFEPYLPGVLRSDKTIFECIREKDIILYHPYDSFDPVVRLLNEASDDPNVLAIKQTLYRVSGNSPIVAALARAADKGKQVTALIEVKARFDEEHNIEFGAELEQAGAHVIYGVAGVKTHSKITLVVRKEGNSIRRYMHLGTGNYNDVTAKLYTDYSLLTANKELGSDATDFFNSITSYADTPKFKHLIMAPTMMRREFNELIRAERTRAENGQRAEIFAKMNSLVDAQTIRELYKASAAGVKIRLLVRGICCLKPGIPGISDNIEVRSIVGRFLEHSRIYSFYNGGEQKLYLSSADWMTRNLDKRIELLFPILDRDAAKKINNDIETYWKDTAKARVLGVDGEYHQLASDVKITAQEQLIKNNEGRND